MSNLDCCVMKSDYFYWLSKIFDSCKSLFSIPDLKGVNSSVNEIIRMRKNSEKHISAKTEQ